LAKVDASAPVFEANKSVAGGQRPPPAVAASVIAQAKREIIVVDLGSDDDAIATAPPAAMFDAKKAPAASGSSPKQLQQISKGLKRPVSSDGRPSTMLLLPAARQDSQAVASSKRLHGASSSPKKNPEPEKGDNFLTVGGALSTGSTTVPHHNKVVASKDKDKDRYV
jgi:hypothetical protein